MRVVHLTSVHPWHDTRIFQKMCRSLASQGHDVHLVVPRRDATRPAVCDGVAIYPIDRPRRRAQRLLFTARSVFARAAALDGALYHFHDPELLPWAAAFQRRTRRPVVYDVHEDVRIQTRYKPWIPSWARGAVSRLAGCVEDLVSARVSAVVAATPAIARRFAAHPRCVLVQNFPLADELGPYPAESHPQTPDLFAYVGGIDRLRGVFEMLAALPLAGARARLVLAGRFTSPALAGQCRAAPGWRQVIDAGYLDRAGVRNALCAACAGLVVLHPLGNYVESYPTKMFEYMAAGLPVIASDFPLWRSIVEEAGCGLLVDPLDPGAIAAAMRWIIAHPDEARDMGRRGRQAVLERYNWEQEAGKLFALYEHLTGCPATAICSTRASRQTTSPPSPAAVARTGPPPRARGWWATG